MPKINGNPRNPKLQKTFSGFIPGCKHFLYMAATQANLKDCPFYYYKIKCKRNLHAQKWDEQ